MSTTMTPIVETGEWAGLSSYELPNPAGRIKVDDELTETGAFESLLATGMARVDRVLVVLDSYWGAPAYRITVTDRKGRYYQFSCYKHSYRWSSWGPTDEVSDIAFDQSEPFHTAIAHGGTPVMADSEAHLAAGISFLEAWKTIMSFEASLAGRERHAASWYDKWGLALRRGNIDYARELATRLDQLVGEVAPASPFRRWVDAYLRERDQT